MDFQPDSPIFDTLLDLNPWAAPFWAERKNLIAGQRWNVNAISQGGNPETRAWMKRFLVARSEATLAMLLKATSDFDEWNLQTRALAMRVFDDPRIDTSHIGIPLLSRNETGGVASNAAIVSTYSNGQFLADFLLLAQASLRGLVFNEPLNISERSFSVGLDMQNAIFKAPLTSNKAVFGPFSYFEMIKCAEADFSQADFYGTTCFTAATFYGEADFTGATFYGPFSTTTIFESVARFRSASFDADVDFSGTYFGERPDFSEAIFRGNTTFADAIFEESADFNGASFPGRVWVGKIPASVRKGIESAEHPE